MENIFARNYILDIFVTYHTNFARLESNKIRIVINWMNISIVA